MTRETAVAIWYRRLDPGCFTSGRHAHDGEGRPSMEASQGEPVAPEPSVYASKVSDHWPSLTGDRRGWSVEAAADRP